MQASFTSNFRRRNIVSIKPSTSIKPGVTQSENLFLLKLEVHLQIWQDLILSIDGKWLHASGKCLYYSNIEYLRLLYTGIF